MPNTETPQGYSLKHLVESYGFGIKVLCLEEGVLPFTIISEDPENSNNYLCIVDGRNMEISVMKECKETNDYYICQKFLKERYPHGSI